MRRRRSSTSGGSSRQPQPGDHRRACQSSNRPLSATFISDYASFQAAVERLAPAVLHDLPVADLVQKPIVEEVERAIADNLQLGSEHPIPNVADLEAKRLSLRRLRQLPRKARERSTLESPSAWNWIGSNQLQAQIRKKTNDLGSDLVELGSEIVIKMTVFHHRDQALPMQEIQLLGSNTLQDAADAMACDLAVWAPALLKQLPSAYFLIEDRFHDNLQATSARSMSAPIMEWVRRDRRYAHRNLALFQRGMPMHETHLRDLSFRPGSIYHYVHMGGCRHPIVFTDVSVLAADDIQNRRVYPMQVGRRKEKRRRCGVCGVDAATFVTYGDRLAPTNPFFYCSRCYHPFHYSEDGKLLYDGFRVYPYFYE